MPILQISKALVEHLPLEQVELPAMLHVLQDDTSGFIKSVNKQSKALYYHLGQQGD
ncbi:hypothetical protein BH10BAC3_BH10BAC3_12020 [soil metagenome]